MADSHYIIPAVSQNEAYAYLLTMAKNHDDEVKFEGKSSSIPKELSYTDYQMQIDSGKVVGINLTESPSHKNIFDPRHETLRKTYALLRARDAQDGHLDGEIGKDLLQTDLSVDLDIDEVNTLTTKEIEKKYFYSVFEVHLYVDHPEQEYLGTAFVKDVINNHDGSHTYYLLTNHHVVNEVDKEEIAIGLVSRDSILNTKAEIVGVDSLADVAVISITFKDSELRSSIEQDTLVAIPWGDSSSVQNGDPVVSIGNTKGLGIALATGQINAASTGKNFYKFAVMQTDAATNHGNSGCPILNTAGKLIGLHFSGDRDTGVLMGYEIPVDRVKSTYQNILDNRHDQAAIHGYWGMSISVLEKELQDILFEGKNLHGVAVISVIKGSPADVAGIKSGDILITEQPFYEPSRRYLVTTPMLDSKKGEKINLQVWRQGKIIPVEIIAEERPYGIAEAFHTEKGFTVCDLSLSEIEAAQIGTDGVRVVLDNSKTTWLGDLTNGMMITQINGKNTADVKSFKKYWEEAMQNKSDGPIILTVYNTALDYDAWGQIDSVFYVLVKK